MEALPQGSRRAKTPDLRGAGPLQEAPGGVLLIVLDTDVLVDFLRNEAAAVRAVTGFLEQGEKLSTTTINAGELYRGAMGGRDAARAMETLHELLESLELLPVDHAAARRYGQVLSALDRAGRPIPGMDALVAAVALEAGGRLCTGNARHFSPVGGLEILSP